MEYSNHQPPEGINASLQHPLKEFVWLSASVLSLFLVLLIIAIALADRFSDSIPFEVEKQFTSSHLNVTPAPQPLQNYLDSLASRLSSTMNLPEGMTISVHYLEGDTVNAFATLGGNIYLYRGLLQKMPNENALAMVMAHEIAHIKHRDPIRGTGRLIVVSLALSMLSSQAGNALLEETLSNEAMLTILKYSRDQESTADEAALKALQGLYGHTEGASALFEILKKEDNHEPLLEFFSTHPLSSKRIEHARESNTLKDNDIHVTTLPDDFSSWLEIPVTAESDNLE